MSEKIESKWAAQLPKLKPLTVKSLREYLSRFDDNAVVTVKLPALWGNGGRDQVEIIEAIEFEDFNKDDREPGITAVW